jgi:hypothetical protein
MRFFSMIEEPVVIEQILRHRRPDVRSGSSPVFGRLAV